MKSITNDTEHAAAIEQMIVWEQSPDAANNNALAALADAVEAYENATPGHRIGPPQTPEGIREVEEFKQRIAARK